MSELTQSPAGTFCWIEHASNDPRAAMKFYGDLFEWHWVDQPPMSDGAPYAMGKLNGKNVCGMTALQADAKKMGAKPSWLSYVAVDDVTAAVATADQLNAKTLMAAEDVGPGRMALIADPTGSVLALWQAKSSMGPWLYGEEGALCWNELLSSNVDVAGGFYSKMFGWKGETMQMGDAAYTVFKRGDKRVAGLMAKPKQMPAMPTGWAMYVQVANADRTIAKALTLGAKVSLAATDAPNVGRFAMLADPLGVPFGILQPSSR